MVDLVADLIARGHAYMGGDGVYFSTESVPGLRPPGPPRPRQPAGGGTGSKRAGSGQAVAAGLRAVEAGRRQASRHGRPLGAGAARLAHRVRGDVARPPGPRVSTCTWEALDLAFPHHENERAQAVAAGKVFALRWAHNGMVLDEQGDKMSRSVGNVTSLARVPGTLRRPRLAGTGPPGPLPLAHGLSAPGHWSRRRRALDRLDNFARETRDLPATAPDAATLASFRARMDDDFDTPGGAGGASFVTVKEARPTRPGRRRLAAAVRQCCELGPRTGPQEPTRMS